MPLPLAELNACDLERFLAVCGPLYEHSPWVAERAFSRRPFASLAALHWWPRSPPRAPPSSSR